MDTLERCPNCGNIDGFYVVDEEYLCVKCDFYTQDGAVHGMTEETDPEDEVSEVDAVEDQGLSDAIRQLQEELEKEQRELLPAEPEEEQEVKPKKKQYYKKLNVAFKPDFIEKVNTYCVTNGLTKRVFVKSAIDALMSQNGSDKEAAQMEGLQIALQESQDEIAQLKEELAKKRSFWKRWS